jgi:peptidoglycan hydrolase-like protein with peptidoglycan-binding domain
MLASATVSRRLNITKGAYKMALTWPLEQQGSTGEDVKTVQYLVTAHGYATLVDGIFGPLTKAAVEAFQKSHGLGIDGIVGPQTWPQLIIEVQQGSTGEAVSAVQSQIHGRGLNASMVAVDGIFGPITNDAVRAFQSLLGLAIDGIVGPQTWNHLINGYLTAPDSTTDANDVFSAWEAHNQAQAGKNATPQAVTQLFAQTFSPSEGWTFQGSNGAAGTMRFTWQRTNGHQLAIDVVNGVDGYFAAYQAQFT